MTKRPTVGRPPRAKRAALARIGLRLTADEQRRWQAAADARDMSLAAFVRQCVDIVVSR